MLTEGDERPARRRFGGRWLTWLLTVLTVLFAAAAGLRIVMSEYFGNDGFSGTAAALALTPYVAATGLVLALLSVVFRRWGNAVVAVVLTAVLACLLLPRVSGDDQPPVEGPQLRVLAVNLYYGQADVPSVVEAVRTHSVDVLALSELTPEAAAALEEEGLGDMLPNQHFEPGPRAEGGGLATRHPLEVADLVGPTTFRLPSARVDVHGHAVEVVAVHAMPPVNSFDDWVADLRSLPRNDQRGAIRVLAGDFNATLDHAEFRRVLDGGYVDAADALGEGLTTTWPRQTFAPPVTLDHVLVDPRAAVYAFETVEIAGSDHDAVLTTLRLPS